MSGLLSGKPQRTPVSASSGQTNDGVDSPASLSQQGFFTADLSIPVTSRSARHQPDLYPRRYGHHRNPGRRPFRFIPTI